MITVHILGTEDDTGVEAELSISLRDSSDDDTGSYTVQVAVTRGAEVGIYQYTIYDFPFKKYNVLGLVQLALMGLTEDQMEITHGDAGSPDMARRQRRPLAQIQAWAGELYHNRSPLRRRQSLEHGDDRGGKEICEEDR